MEDYNFNSTVSKNNSRRFSVSYISSFIYTHRKKKYLVINKKYVKTHFIFDDNPKHW